MSSPDDKDWKWFPNNKDGWSLDVVTLLAVIGESSVAEHSQAITASLLGLMPRLLPAPQALLKPSRPSRMPETHAKMTGVHSGTTLDTVGYFANIITPLDAETMPAFSFKMIDIKHRSDYTSEEVVDTSPNPASDHGMIFTAVRHGWYAMQRVLGRKPPNGRDMKGIPIAPPKDEESGGTDARGIEMQQNPTAPPARVDGAHENNAGVPAATNNVAPDQTAARLRRRSFSRRLQDSLTNPTMPNTASRPAVPPRLFSPIHLLTIFSSLLSLSIIGAAIKWKDGNAIVAVSLISMASSVVGYASFWKPVLMSRSHSNDVPDGDVMIRTREGAFVLIRCTEDVTRELYSGTEECHYYVGPRAYRLLMVLGTALLMLSVVLLGNCQWNSQIFIGGSYIVLNGLYWALGMLEGEYFWDLDRYEVTVTTPADAQKAHLVTDPSDEWEGHPSYTRTLWYAIRETQVTGWVQRSGAFPETPMWKAWLDEAKTAVDNDERQWKAVGRKNDLLRHYAKKDRRGRIDLAADAAPTGYIRESLDEARLRRTRRIGTL